MYESPVIIFEKASEMFEDFNARREAAIVKQIQMYVDVDKNELIRALNYDRDQYNKGFVDGAQWASQKEIPKKPKEESMYPWCECGCLLASESITDYKYCPHCGQKIDWSEED